MVVSERSSTPEKLLDILPPDMQDQAICESSLENALAKAVELAGDKDLICIAGSLYLIGEARKLLLGEIV
jgi:dihydrofolate synthase/folylpolyglutamate synthase